MADETPVAGVKSGGIVEFLRGLPVVGGLFKGAAGGYASSEGGLAAVLVGLIGVEVAKAEPNPYIVGGLALALVGVGIYSCGRSNTKAIAPVLLCALALGAGGCASTDPALRDGLYRFGETGRSVQPYLQPAASGGQQALYDAFDAAIVEALKVGKDR